MFEHGNHSYRKCCLMQSFQISRGAHTAPELFDTPAGGRADDHFLRHGWHRRAAQLRTRCMYPERLPAGTVNESYNAVLAVSGGSSPYHFSVKTGVPAARAQL